MAIAFKAGATFVTAASTTEDLTIPGTPAENDIVEIINVSDRPLTDPVTTTVTGTIYNGDDPVNGVFLNIEYIRQTDPPITVVGVDSAATVARIMVTIIRVFTGIDTTTALDAAATQASGTTGDPDPPVSNATVTANAWMNACGAQDDDNAALSASTGYTDFFEQIATGAAAGEGCAVGVGSKLIASASTTDDPGTMASTGDDAWQGVTWPWRPAVGGGGGDIRRHIIPAYMRLSA